MNSMTSTALNTLTTTGPMIRTRLPGPNARRIIEADERLISPSYTRSYPLVAKSGRGIVIEDVDGNEFFDFSAGHCRCQHRPLPSRGCFGNSAASG